MTPPLRPEPLTQKAFAPFGRVIAADPETAREINAGATIRFHALADAAPGPEGRAILSIFRSRARQPGPVALAMVERHPLGAQAFMPLGGGDWLVVVAERPVPEALRAFRARGDQGVQYAAGTWHHPLLTLGPERDFLVVDRAGPGDNLEEVVFSEPRLLTP